MKQIKWGSLVIVLLVSMTSSWVMAHGGHFRGHGGYYRGYGGHGFGFYSGLPWPFYFPFYAPYYSYPPAIIPPLAPPQVYIQRYDRQIAPPPPANYWYYCRNPDGYYPYIRECPSGWHQVAPQPPLR